MSAGEIALLTRSLQQVRGAYFEFGCGGSTTLATMCPNLTSITSVDSSPLWIYKVKKATASASMPINMIYVDINADNYNWGKPKDRSKVNNWPLYSRAIQGNTPPLRTPLDAQTSIPTKFSAILVDGRFRVACALHALDYLDDKGILLVHDYTNRPQYHVIEQFYHKIGGVETLAVFQKGGGGPCSPMSPLGTSNSIDLKRLNELRHKYELIFD
jgi:hypothetical protein